jgi:curved DNA-binding protein CbpA
MWSDEPVEDPYLALGVAKDADISAIRSAHRKLALKYHPDRLKGDEEWARGKDVFQKVQRAYELLSDPTTRARYDNRVKLAQLKKEAMTRDPSPRTPAYPKYRDGGIYEERAPNASYFEEGYRYREEEPRTTYRMYDGYERERRPDFGQPEKERKSTKWLEKLASGLPFNSALKFKLKAQIARERVKEKTREKEIHVPSAKSRDRDHRSARMDKQSSRSRAYMDGNAKEYIERSQRPVLSGPPIAPRTYWGLTEDRQPERKSGSDSDKRPQSSKGRKPSIDAHDQSVGMQRVDSSWNAWQNETEFRPKDLPINIKGKKLDASPDTGSDECCMPKDVADKLGLKVCQEPSDIKSFETGDGRILKSIGRTTIDCSFWKEPGRKIRCVVYVFEKLITPLIMGRKFLESTETLTRHQNRLVDRPPRAGVCRVMHLSRPKRRMRCYIGSDLVNANPDTGAEMELVSPEFVKRKGYTVTAPDAEHEEVQFVDGSTARTQGQVTMRFEAYGDALQEAIPTKARYRKFYVIDGLTTDVLLGEDLLYGINAFTDHASSFIDVDEFGLPLELKGIVWLDRAEQRLARVFGGDILDMSAQASPGSAGKRLISK